MTNNFYLRVLSIFFLAPIVITFIYLGDIYFSFLLFLIFIPSYFEIIRIKKKILRFFTIFLITVFIIFSYKIRNSDNGMFFFFYILTITWLTDIGGYVFGKLIKGPKIKLISPNKTYAGFLGSIILAQLFNFFIFSNFSIFQNFTINSIFVLFLTISTIIGDLFFSYIKRISNIKDFSNILPGHGGILDRIDGMIFSVILFYITRFFL